MFVIDAFSCGLDINRQSDQLLMALKAFIFTCIEISFCYFVWLQITDEGPVPEMRKWPAFLIKSNIKRR